MFIQSKPNQVRWSLTLPRQNPSGWRVKNDELIDLLRKWKRCTTFSANEQKWLLFMLHFKPRCSLKEGFHDFYLYNHSLLALSESQYFAVVTKPVATSKKTFIHYKFPEEDLHSKNHYFRSVYSDIASVTILVRLRLGYKLSLSVNKSVFKGILITLFIKMSPNFRE